MSVNDYYRIGVVTGTHGLDGCLKVHIVTDFPERFSGKKPVYVNIRGHYKEYSISGFTISAKRRGYLYLNGIDDTITAASLKGCELFAYLEDDDMVLDEDSFHYSAIIGCEVHYNNAVIGRVTDIMQTGSADTLVIKTPLDKQYLIPFVKSMVKTERLNQHIIEIMPIEGIIE